MRARALGLFGALALLLASPAVRGQDHLASARDIFRRGSELYAAGRAAEAADAFRASLALYSSPNTRLLLARTFRKLERYADAALEYERTIRDAEDPTRGDGRYGTAAGAARTELASLEARIGRVELVFRGDPRGAKVTFDGREIEGEALRHPIPTMPGRVEIVAAHASAKARAVAIVDAGEMAAVVLDLGERVTPDPPIHRVRPAEAVATAPLPSLAPPRPIIDPPPPASQVAAPWGGAATWVSLGVGVAGAATFGALFAATDAKYTELVRTCVETSCPDARYRELRSGGEALQTATNTTLVIATLAVTVGATLFYLNRPRAARVTVGAGGAAIEGTW